MGVPGVLAWLEYTSVKVNITQLATSSAGMMIVIGVALFLPAGTLTWPAGWAFLLLMFGFGIAESLWLLRFNPDLLAERLTGIGRADQKIWDKVFLALTAVAFFGWLAIMGFDAVRFRWSHLPPWVQGIGAIALSA